MTSTYEILYVIELVKFLYLDNVSKLILYYQTKQSVSCSNQKMLNNVPRIIEAT